MIEPLSKEKAIHVIRAGFVRVLMDVAFQCSTPIYWFTASRGRRGPVLNNGTAFFVDAGAGAFGVTACHVIEGYRTAVRKDPATRCELGGINFDPMKVLIGEDRRSDIATFRVEPTLPKILDRIAHQNPRGWPPKPPEVGKGIFFGGYPGKYRIERPGVIQWTFDGGLDVAASVHEDHISIHFSREDWVPEEGVEPPQPGEPWGGVSGAPVFAVVQNGVVSWRLAGVATEFGTTFEILHVSSLSRVRPDG